MLGNFYDYQYDYGRLIIFFVKKILQLNTIKVSSGLDPDQDQHNVGPDLGLNCLQGLSADDKYSH